MSSPDSEMSLPCLLFLTHLFLHLWSRGVETCSPSPGQGEAQMGQFLSKIRCGVALSGPLPWYIQTVFDSKMVSFALNFLKI